MTKTVKEHFEDCKDVSEIIDNANALLIKCQRELAMARALLDAIKPYQHEMLKMPAPYGWSSRTKNLGDCRPTSFIEEEIEAINNLLGDRA